jgi:hypothetical protein
VALQSGGKGLYTCCPAPGCAEPVSGDAWAAWLPAEAAPLRRRLTLRAFVKGNALLAWCPGAGCERAVAVVSEAGCSEVLCGAPPPRRWMDQPRTSAADAHPSPLQPSWRWADDHAHALQPLASPLAARRVRELLLRALRGPAALAGDLRAAPPVGGDPRRLARRAAAQLVATALPPV